MSVRQEIVDACAWMLWADAWVSLQDRLAEDGEKHASPGAGGLWDPLVPDVPARVKEGAVKLVEAIERLNGAPIDRLYARAVALPGKRYTTREPTPERFGNCLAYQAIGAGVSWADDYPAHGLMVPYVECIAHSDTDAEISVVERLARRH